MGEIISYQKYIEPRRVFDPILKREVEILGQYGCKDERVGRVWFTGELSLKEEVIVRCHFLFKNGEQHSFKIEYPLVPQGNLETQAEAFLKSIT